MKCCIVTLGCQMNQSDSERVRSVIEGMGYEMVASEEEADLIGVVACSVRQKAIDKVYSKILKWNKWKDNRPLVTFVSGCILPADEKKFLKLFDLVFRMNELPDLPERLHECGVVTEFSTRHPLNDLEREDERTDFWQVDPAYSSDFEAFVPIQNGCNKFCTYCAVPYTRGREVSRSSADILAEVEQLVEHGVKSITLLGQNVNSYGLDKTGEEISFAELLRRVGEMGRRSGREFWTYFTSPHPRDMTREVIEAVSEYECLAKQIHLPVQSGDDELLRRMNRNYTTEDYLKIIADIRELLPAATIFTDIIVGFSGETGEQLENSAKLMEEVGFNMAYVAKYSPRVGAKAAEWEDDISPKEKSIRLARLAKVLKRTSLAHNEAMVGKIHRVLIDGKDRRVEGALTSRTEGKLPIRILGATEELVGTFQNIEITSAAELSLTGNLAPA
ncbi:MAG: tRNA (N6-isopentenyl adenosine(37)-C2)-methylthiotransferase MiaB [Verrucomicrobiota bacterium]